MTITRVSQRIVIAISSIGIPRGLFFLMPAAAGMLLFTGKEAWLLSFALLPVFAWLIVNIRGAATAAPATAITPLYALLFLYWLWLILSIVWSISPAESLTQLWPSTLFILVFLAWISEPAPKQLWQWLCIIGLGIGLVLSILSFYQHYVLGEHARSVFVTRNTHGAFMTLLLLPTIAYAIRPRRSAPARVSWTGTGVFGLVFVFSLSIALTTSRGAALSMALALALLLTVAFRHRLWKPAALVILLVVAAFAFAKLPFGSAELLDKPALLDAHSRLPLWLNTWRMFGDAPWLGIGIGMYPWAWPPYRDPSDSSAGIFAHNDYLQLATESGTPSVLLLLGFGFVLLRQTVRALSARTTTPVAALELTGLSVAVLAVAMHSFVDFNFHIPAVMLVLGLILGRLYELSAGRAPEARLLVFRNRKKRVALTCASLLLTLAAIFLATQAIGELIAQQAVRFARAGELTAADKTFHAATTLAPLNERITAAHADLLRQMLLPAATQEKRDRNELFHASARLLNRAERLHPLRWDTVVTRAKLYQDNPEFLGQDWPAASITAYQYALTLNPWLYQARVDLASLLHRTGDVRSAADLVAQGLHLVYPATLSVLTYYSVTQALQQQWGSRENAALAQQKFEMLDQSLHDPRRVSNCPLPGHIWGSCW